MTKQLNKSSSSKKTIPKLFRYQGALPGIKVDTGAKVLAGSPEEKITEGLDGLRERLKDYYKLGARFTKWRGVYNISNKFHHKLSIHSNAHALARYSALVQECKNGSNCRTRSFNGWKSFSRRLL